MNGVAADKLKEYVRLGSDTSFFIEDDDFWIVTGHKDKRDAVKLLKDRANVNPAYWKITNDPAPVGMIGQAHYSFTIKGIYQLLMICRTPTAAFAKEYMVQQLAAAGVVLNALEDPNTKLHLASVRNENGLPELRAAVEEKDNALPPAREAIEDIPADAAIMSFIKPIVYLARGVAPLVGGKIQESTLLTCVETAAKMKGMEEETKRKEQEEETKRVELQEAGLNKRKEQEEETKRVELQEVGLNKRKEVDLKIAEAEAKRPRPDEKKLDLLTTKMDMIGAALRGLGAGVPARLPAAGPMPELPYSRGGGYRMLSEAEPVPKEVMENMCTYLVYYVMNALVGTTGIVAVPRELGHYPGYTRVYGKQNRRYVEAIMRHVHSVLPSEFRAKPIQRVYRIRADDVAVVCDLDDFVREDVLPDRDVSDAMVMLGCMRPRPVASQEVAEVVVAQE